MKAKKYRKLPVEIEAIKYTREHPADLLDFVHAELIGYDTDKNEYYIRTLEGNMYISEGDYVIKGVAGEFYPCKPEIFEKTYECTNEPVPPPRPQRWERVAVGKVYSFIGNTGKTNCKVESGDKVDEERYYSGNYYHDKDTAEYYRDLWQLQSEIRRWKREHDPVCLDWKNWNTQKWYIMCCHIDYVLVITELNTCETIFTPFFSTREIAQECIKIYGERIIECIKKGREYE